MVCWEDGRWAPTGSECYIVLEFIPWLAWIDGVASDVTVTTGEGC